MKVLNIRLIHWLAVLLFVGFVLAQDNTKDTTNTDAATTTTQNTQKTSGADTTTAQPTTTTGETTKKADTTTTGETTKKADTTTTGVTTKSDATTTTAQTTKPATTTKAESTSAAATSGATSTSISYSAIQITAVNTMNNGDSGLKPTLAKSKMPTLSTTGVPVPTITVPSNEFNPFLKQQKTPEGTVFIAVGSVLGAIALAVIAWNVALAVIHRRNTRHFHDIGSEPTPLMTEVKDPYAGYNSGNSGAGAGGLNSSDHSGGVGLFGASNKEASRSRSMINSGLFFSPTAQVLNSAQVQNANSANPSITSSMASSTAGVGIIGGPGRASVYMPAGYYDGTGNGGARSVRNMSMYSMSNVSMAGGHQATPPPGATSMLSVPNSTSNPRISQLAAGEQQRPAVRAPSAYLDDFLGFDK